LSLFVETGGQQGVEITSFLNGGEIGAALAASDDVIDKVRRDIGVLAAGLTVQFNQVHREGIALDGASTGINFFASAAGVPNDPSQTSGTGTATISAIIDDPLDPTDDDNITQLTGDSYRLDYSAGNLRVTNLTANTPPQDIIIPAATTDFKLLIDGVTLTIDDTTNLADGDIFLLAPTASAAGNFGVAITDPNDVAAAQALDSPGDNRNIQALIELQDEATLVGEATFADFYTNTTSSIAVQTRRANSLAETEASLLASATARKENVSGVNLEEEAANLIRFQQAFQAAAQVITVSRDIFDTLLRATE